MKVKAIIMQKSVVLAVVLLFVCSAEVFSEAKDPGQFQDRVPQENCVRQILDSNERIDPEQVGDERLKELGETVMSRIIADPVLRAWINDTMGGRNSECLKDMYKMIGYRFLHDH